MRTLLEQNNVNADQARRQLLNWKHKKGLLGTFDRLSPDDVLSEVNARSLPFEALVRNALDILATGSLSREPNSERLLKDLVVESNYEALNNITCARFTTALAQCAPKSTHAMSSSALRFEASVLRGQRTTFMDTWRRLATDLPQHNTYHRHEVALAGVHFDDALRQAWINSLRATESSLPGDDRNVEPKLRARVYYISGWLLHMIYRRSNSTNSPTLTSLYTVNLASDEEREMLPDDYTAAASRGRLIFPGKAFFEFTLLLEACHAQALSIENVLARGANRVVEEMCEALRAHAPLQQRWCAVWSAVDALRDAARHIILSTISLDSQKDEPTYSSRQHHLCSE